MGNRDNRIIKNMYSDSNDISEQIRENSVKIKHSVFSDALTGLYNKEIFIERLNYELSKEIYSAEHIAVIFITIDHFSMINNQFGYKFGDALLKNMAGKLNEVFLECDTIARYGGDEFIILLPHIKDKSDIVPIVENVLKKIGKYCVNIEDWEIDFTVSMGVEIEQKQKAIPDKLINNAHLAMTEAKKDKRSSYRLFNTMMKEKLNHTYIFENALSKALVYNQFFLLYQPIFEVETGKLFGAEALLRWRHPELGILAPIEFLPIAEKNGLIINIGEWVLRRACSFINKLKEIEHSSITIAVNVSAVQLEEDDFVYKIKKILKETKIDPSCLELEITESTAMHNIKNIAQKLKDLKGLGIKIAIDDFGTGYSSLSQLHNLKIDKLKIDRSFIKNINQDATSKSITAAIMNIANTFNLVTVAEGVEELEQLHVLQELKINMFQGYLYGKPLKEDYFIKYMDKIG